MNAKLLVIDGNKVKREVALQLPAVLGRSRSADITVAHPLISRRHCELSEVNGLLMLHDMASLNGTTIGSQRIEIAPLLPDGEFVIGPLTFRVLYEYDGDLAAIPDTRFADETAEVAEAAFAEPPAEDDDDIPFAETKDALPAKPASDSLSGEFSMPDLMALADAEVDEAVPAAAPKRPDLPSVSRRPSTADDKHSVRLSEVLVEPLDVDSSLQSGGYRIESPWTTEPRPMEKPRPAAKAPGAEPSKAPSAEKSVKQPAEKKSTAASPPKKPSNSDETEFGGFLEGLE